MSAALPALLEFVVPGPPHSQKPWVTRVIDAALAQPQVSVPCELDVEFVLAPERVPWILPSETSVGAMLRTLLDALNETVFRESQDAGGSLVALHARSRVARAGEPSETRVSVRRARPAD